MGKRPVRRGATAINPMFYIPEDADELVYRDNNYDAVIEFDEEGDIYEAYVEYVDESDDDSDYTGTPDTPQVLGIIPPQTFRMTDSGAEVVDVVVDVETVLGAEYELRVTKL